MNAMCALTQFVVSTIFFKINADHLATLFMSSIILNFGMCYVVRVDNGSNFKGVFIDMCKILKITHWGLSRGNHKGNAVEKYHRFLNKTQTIHGNDKGKHEVFFQNAKISQFAWNSAPIDNINAIHSIVAVGREFRFTMDVELSRTPPMNTQRNHILFTYL